MEVPGSTPTDSTPREAESRPGNRAAEKLAFRRSMLLACPHHQASAPPIEWRRGYPRFRSRARRHTNRVAPGSPPALVPVPGATLFRKRVRSGGAPQGGDGGAGRAVAAHYAGPGLQPLLIQEAQRPERSEGLANPTNHPQAIDPPTMPGVRAAKARPEPPAPPKRQITPPWACTSPPRPAPPETRSTRPARRSPPSPRPPPESSPVPSRL